MEIDMTPEQITEILSRNGWNFIEYTTQQGFGPLIHVVSFVYKDPPSMAKRPYLFEVETPYFRLRAS